LSPERPLHGSFGARGDKGVSDPVRRVRRARDLGLESEVGEGAGQVVVLLRERCSSRARRNAQIPARTAQRTHAARGRAETTKAPGRGGGGGRGLRLDVASRDRVPPMKGSCSQASSDAQRCVWRVHRPKHTDRRASPRWDQRGRRRRRGSGLDGSCSQSWLHCRDSPAHRTRPRGLAPAPKAGRLLRDVRVEERKTLRAEVARHRSRGTGRICLDRRVSTCGLTSDDVTSWGPGRRRRTWFRRGPGSRSSALVPRYVARCRRGFDDEASEVRTQPDVRNKRLTPGKRDRLDEPSAWNRGSRPRGMRAEWTKAGRVPVLYQTNRGL